MGSNKKELFSFVPQEISRHFIEPSSQGQQQQQTATIAIDQTQFEHIETYDGSTLCEYDYDDDDDSDEEAKDEEESPKWSFVRGLFSKLHLSTSQPPQVDASPNLSTYGTLIHNKRIGEGVSAVVQLTQRQDEIFAVKVFRKRKRRENMTSYMKALAGEFCIASALHHENIIKTLDFVRMDEDPQRYCIVMEYVS
jgi:serine/threonine protein kinase